MSELKKFIFVKGDYAGFHKWDKAPEVVGFLRYPHRHLFKFKTTLLVTHDDRELEFFMVQNEVMLFIQDNFDFKDLGSCEMQAEKIFNFLEKKYPGRPLTVMVSEDGENGAVVARGEDEKSI